MPSDKTQQQHCLTLELHHNVEKLSAHMKAVTLVSIKTHRDLLLGWNKPPSDGTTFAAFRGLG